MAYAVDFQDVVYASGRYTGYMLTRDLDFKDYNSYSDAIANTVAFGATESDTG